jgi:hypothetical protein
MQCNQSFSLQQNTSKRYNSFLTLHTAKAVGFLGTPIYGQDIFQA